jgi:hypothetical protein
VAPQQAKADETCAVQARDADVGGQANATQSKASNLRSVEASWPVPALQCGNAAEDTFGESGLPVGGYVGSRYDRSRATDDWPKSTARSRRIEAENAAAGVVDANELGARSQSLD